jgi:hypothetical protein
LTGTGGIGEVEVEGDRLGNAAFTSSAMSAEYRTR